MNHIAIIPDGNRRWAKKRMLPPSFGHKKGAAAMEKIVTAAFSDLHTPYLTVWGCSVDNIIKRPKKEVAVLFGLFSKHFDALLTSRELAEQDIRVRVLGAWRAYFPDALQKKIERIMRETKHRTRHHLTLLMAYSGTDEMKDAVDRIAAHKEKHPHNMITHDTIKRHLWTNELPPVDLLVRTGGDPHLSAGFMMWDIANAHCYFTDTLWPDFTPQELKQAVARYAQTEKRMGK